VELFLTVTLTLSFLKADHPLTISGL
jgi:hypothetical protein